MESSGGLGLESEDGAQHIRACTSSGDTWSYTRGRARWVHSACTTMGIEQPTVAELRGGFAPSVWTCCGTTANLNVVRGVAGCCHAFVLQLHTLKLVRMRHV